MGHTAVFTPPLEQEGYQAVTAILAMKTALIILFLLQVIDFHLCNHEELDTDLTAEERLEMEAAFEEDDRMLAEDRGHNRPPVKLCGVKRWRECRVKIWKMMISARKRCEGASNPAGCIYSKLDVRFGFCKPCLCRALYYLGNRVFGEKIRADLMDKFDCWSG